MLTGDELVATDVTDFTYLLKIRQAQPDVVCLNLPHQVTNFVKQYSEFGLPYPTVGFNLNTADAWPAGKGNLSGTWRLDPTLDTPGSKAFVEAFCKKMASRRKTMPGSEPQSAEARGAGDGRDEVNR